MSKVLNVSIGHNEGIVDRMLQVHNCSFAYFVLLGLVEKVPALETSVAAAYDAIQGEKIIVTMTPRSVTDPLLVKVSRVLLEAEVTGAGK